VLGWNVCSPPPPSLQGLFVLDFLYIYKFFLDGDAGGITNGCCVVVRVPLK
jgi:hypothetical protein